MQKLGIKTKELGTMMNSSGSFEGQEVVVTPLICKLRIQIQSYVDHEEFSVSPLVNQDVILGAPWLHRKSTALQFLERFLTFSHKDKKVVL